MQKKGNTRRKPHLRLVTPPATEPAEARTSIHTYPEGWREGDGVFSAAVESDAYEHLGLYEGDAAIAYETTDVRAGEIAAVQKGGDLCLGVYRPAPGGYFTFETDEGVERFAPGTALLVGRVCHVERRGEIIRRLRPIR